MEPSLPPRVLRRLLQGGVATSIGVAALFCSRGWRPAAWLAALLLGPAALVVGLATVGLRIADIGDVSAVVRWTVLSCALIFNAWIWGAAIDALRGRRVTGIGPFGVLEWTVLLTAVGIPLAVVAPGLTSARQKATAADCDNVYVALKREVAGEIDHLLNSTDTGTCDGTNTQDVIACVVARHQEATNPRNRAQPAYTSGEPDPCQVQVVALGHDAILFRQQAHRRFEPRTFRVQIEGREAPR